MESSGERPDIGDRIKEKLDEPSSRREVLKKLGIAAGVTATLGAVTAAEKTFHPLRNIGRRFGIGKDHEIERKIVSWVEDPQHPWPKSVKVGIDAEGLPVKSILPTGEEVKFGAKKAREVRELAKHTQEPEIAEIVGIPVKEDRENIGNADFIEDHFEPTEAHPKVEELPEDVLTEQQLRERGIRIVQTDKVKLYLRKSAFEEGGALHGLDGRGHSINIVLVDGAVVTEELLVDEQHKPFKSLLGKRTKEIQEFRKKKIEESAAIVDRSKAGYAYFFQEYKAGRGEYSTFYANILLDAKAQAPVWKEHITDGEAYVYMASHGATQGDAAGLYVSPNNNIANLFVTAGSSEFKSDLAYLYFDHEDKLKVRVKPLEYRQNDYVESSGSESDYTPRISQTHPDPAGFTLNENAKPSDPKSYPYAGQTPGLVLRHEVAHHELIGGNPKNPNYSEYDTDMRAMRGIREAWEKWVSSGYRDDSGYNFVFQTQRGIILT
jgi:hypothetical protein